MKYLNSKTELVNLENFDVVDIKTVNVTVKDENGKEKEEQRFIIAGTKVSTPNSDGKDQSVSVIIEGLFEDEKISHAFYTVFLDMVRRDIKFFTYGDIITVLKTPKEDMEKIVTEE